MNGLIGLISLSALLLAVSGQFPTLSPSFSYQGTVVATGTVSFTGTISQAVDIDRGLAYERITQTVIGQDPVTTIALLSANDNTLYASVDGTCTQITLPNDSIPLDRNVWDMYANAVEGPIGTFTLTQNGIVTVIVIVNGEPAVISVTSGTTVSVVTISNYDNTTPAFSTFSLPSECSQFTCDACYQTSQFPTLSPSFSYQGTVVATGTVSLTGTISQAVDIDRGLAYERITETVIGQDPVTTIALLSANDNTLYTSIDGSCTQITLPNDSIPLDRNVWDMYANAVENPAGTFTLTQSGAISQVVIVNGVPARISSVSGTEVSTIIITNYDNTTPAFSTFSLPSECSQFTCDACYNSAVSVSISVLLLLTTLLLYLFAVN